MNPMIQKYSQPNNHYRTNNVKSIPHCLTRQFQDTVAKIQTTDNPDRGVGKKTGIWDETNRCKD